MIQRKAEKWGVNDGSSEGRANDDAYREGFEAGKNYIKDNVKLTVSNDAIASSYQTLKHYRESLIKWVDKL